MLHSTSVHGVFFFISHIFKLHDLPFMVWDFEATTVKKPTAKKNRPKQWTRK